MYPHKCKLKKLKEKYQEKWENAHLSKLKNFEEKVPGEVGECTFDS